MQPWEALKQEVLTPWAEAGAYSAEQALTADAAVERAAEAEKAA